MYTRARTYTHVRMETSKSAKKLIPCCVQLQVQPVINMRYNCIATVCGRSGTMLQNYEAVLTLSAPNYLVKLYIHVTEHRNRFLFK
jgi:hypothetical protein